MLCANPKSTGSLDEAFLHKSSLTMLFFSLAQGGPISEEMTGLIPLAIDTLDPLCIVDLQIEHYTLSIPEGEAQSGEPDTPGIACTLVMGFWKTSDMTDFETNQALDKIKAISFDGDGTLWDFQSAMESALALTLQHLQAIVANDAALKLTVEKMIETRDVVAKQLGEQAVGLEVIRHTSFVKTLQDIGAPSQELADELYQLYMEARFAGTKPYAEIPAVLSCLKTRYQVGIISNGNSYPERIGFPDVFDFVIFADKCGFAKPDRGIFEFALSRSGHKPEEVLHVGDSLENDVLGANNSGLRSVWLNRERANNQTGITPDLEVIDLQELVGVLLVRRIGE